MCQGIIKKDQLMEGKFQDQGHLDQDLEEWLSPIGSQSVHSLFSEENKL